MRRLTLGALALGTFCLGALLPSAAVAQSAVGVASGGVAGAPTEPLASASAASTSFVHCSQPSGLNTTIFMEFSVSSSTVGTRDRTCEITARCIDQDTGNLFTFVDVMWKLEAVPNSGFHDHHSAQRPLGTIDAPSGDTGSTGVYTTTYNVPEVSGRVKAILTCSHPFIIFGGPAEFFFEVAHNPHFYSLVASSTYDLVGTTSTVGQRHLSNHAGSSALLASLGKLATSFATAFPGSKLALNDMSLPWGGLFDLGSGVTCGNGNPGVDWGPCHFQHRFGRNADVEDVPAVRLRRLRQLATLAGFTGFLNEGNHYHLTR